MSSHSSHERGSTPTRSFSVVHLLENGDGVAHVLVAALLLLLAIAILVSGTFGFVNDVMRHPEAAEFPVKALKYLSDLLFGVIVLELLSTILTYIQARNLEATIKDFLVVGLISSIRKILLIGAQSSLEKTTGEEFQKEAIGTVISIIGIILLIGGLLLLDRRVKAAKLVEAPTEIE